MNKESKAPKLDSDQIMVTQIDLVAFIRSEYKTHPIEKGMFVMHGALRASPYWIFPKTKAVETAISEFKNMSRERTKVIDGFRQSQIMTRNEVKQMERQA